MRYLYWTLRYLPDAARGEFVNIGLIVGRDGADWAMRSIQSFDRASRIGGDLNVARDWIRTLRHEVSSAGKQPPQLFYKGVAASERWLDELRILHNNSVQVSEPLPVVATTAEEAAELLYERLIVEPVRVSRSTSHSRAMGKLKSAYTNLRSDRDLFNKVKVRSGRQLMDFDFALKGNRIEQLSRVWSFDLKDVDSQVEKVQAWGFRIEQLRESGGELLVGNNLPLRVDEDVPVRVLYVPPQTPSQSDSLAIARDAWQRIDAEAFAVNHEEDLVRA